MGETSPDGRWDRTASVDERRNEILRSLSQRLRKTKLSKLNVDDIAKDLNLVRGNIYYYFKNKNEIFFHCHMKCMESSLMALDEVAAMDGSAEERLSTLLRRHIEVLTSSPFSGVLLADISELSSSQRAEYVSLRDRFEEGVRGLISEAIETGQFRAQDVSLAGFTILGAINWIPKWYDADGELSAEAVAAGMADMLVRGLR